RAGWIVLEFLGVRREEASARCEGVGKFARDAGKLAAVGQVVKDFRADQQIEALRQVFVEEIHAAIVDVGECGAPAARARQGGLGNVRGREVLHSGGEQAG